MVTLKAAMRTGRIGRHSVSNNAHVPIKEHYPTHPVSAWGGLNKKRVGRKGAKRDFRETAEVKVSDTVS